jgi:hypothetical protein
MTREPEDRALGSVEVARLEAIRSSNGLAVGLDVGLGPSVLIQISVVATAVIIVAFREGSIDEPSTTSDRCHRGLAIQSSNEVSTAVRVAIESALGIENVAGIMPISFDNFLIWATLRALRTFAFTSGFVVFAAPLPAIATIGTTAFFVNSLFAEVIGVLCILKIDIPISTSVEIIDIYVSCALSSQVML